VSWRHILVAVATPAVETNAMNKVARLARALDADLELFHCIYDSGISRPGRFGSRGIEQDIRELVAQRQRQLEISAQRLRAAGVRARATVRWDYPPHEGVIRQVLRHKPDLLIAQSTRRGRIARRVLTQTDYKLIEGCPCPLLLLKTDRPYSDSYVLAAVDPTHAHDKPAALDNEIIDAASAVSDALGAVLHVYHACKPWRSVVKDLSELRHVPGAIEADLYATYCARSEAAVRQIARRQKLADARVHLEEGDVAKTLPRFVSSVSADIVAMGAVSRSLKGLFIGHTAERVLDALDCDVLIVKPPGFRCPVGRQSVHRVTKRDTRRARYIF
jgi:universal stress protein E